MVNNKVAPPFKQAEFDIIYGEGISRESNILELGAQQGIIDKSGAWYSYEGERLGQGRDNARESLRNNPAMCQEIEEKIRETFDLTPVKTKPSAITDSLEEQRCSGPCLLKSLIR